MRVVSGKATVYERGSSAARLGIGLIELAIGYEWIISALNKMTSSDFSSGLASELKKSLSGNPNRWYSDFLKSTIIPHARIYAVLVELSELLVGLGFVVGAVLWLSTRLAGWSWARVVHWVVILALAGGAMLTANYYIQGGDTLPGLNPGNPYSEGLTIDGLLTLVALALVVAHVIAQGTPPGRRVTHSRVGLGSQEFGEDRG
jgi:uncharacterized membrane protein YphA (DoxX/SURF4 family)